VAETSLHPLLEFLDPQDALSARGGFDRGVVERVEKRDLKGSSKYADTYYAFFLKRGVAGVDLFPCLDHIDVGWAAGALIYQWYIRHGVPANKLHFWRALFAIEDVLLQQELKCWFWAEMAAGRCRAKPIVEGFDATSPGKYFSVNDFLMTAPEYRKSAELWLRVSAILLPVSACGTADRELTMTADGQSLTYKEGDDGERQVTSQEGAGSSGPSLDEIIAIANRNRAARKGKS
jgi:hypothetical protein